MKVFFVGFMMGFIIAFYFMKKDFSKKAINGDENAEYIFPLKPDLEPKEKENDEKK